MRQMNRLMNDYELLNKFFSTSISGIYNESIFLKYIIFPLCIGLKIIDNEKLDMMLMGKGYDELENYVLSNEFISKIMQREYNIVESDNNSLCEKIKEEYNKYFVDNGDYTISIHKRNFLDAFSLLGNRVVISEE